MGKKVIYVFQGGGALGSFQVGGFKALSDKNYQPDMVVGGSIGGINAAIIAGNKPENRHKMLNKFWKKITTGVNTFGFNLPDLNSYKTGNFFGAISSAMFGQPGFFAPRFVNQWFMTNKLEDMSLYDIEPLRKTLNEVIDFDYLNQGHVRLCLSATDLQTGNLVFFDSIKEKITTDHLLASGALPPGFPVVRINDNFYVDGAIYSNSPQMTVLNSFSNDKWFDNASCFVFDLFSADGVLPNSMDGVMERIKDIRFSSHSKHSLLEYKQSQDLAYAIKNLYDTLPDNLRSSEEMKNVMSLGRLSNLDLVHIPYRSPKGTELESKDYNFSYDTALIHIQQGFEITQKAIHQFEYRTSQDIGKCYTVDEKVNLVEI
ncbi:MAG: patatin-like phospholipase family protein [Burkholderiales bacterium]|nr:patatin-like phospholipase family protein [Burkholderiales bacterium]